MSKRRKQSAPKERNPYVAHARMRVSGAHTKTRKAERRAAKVKFAKEIEQ